MAKLKYRGKGNKYTAENVCKEKLIGEYQVEQEMWNGEVTSVLTELYNGNCVTKWFLDTQNLVGLPIFDPGCLLFYQEVLR